MKSGVFQLHPIGGYICRRFGISCSTQGWKLNSSLFPSGKLNSWLEQRFLALSFWKTREPFCYRRKHQRVPASAGIDSETVQQVQQVHSFRPLGTILKKANYHSMKTTTLLPGKHISGCCCSGKWGAGVLSLMAVILRHLLLMGAHNNAIYISLLLTKIKNKELLYRKKQFRLVVGQVICDFRMSSRWVGLCCNLVFSVALLFCSLLTRESLVL